MALWQQNGFPIASQGQDCACRLLPAGGLRMVVQEGRGAEKIAPRHAIEDRQVLFGVPTASLTVRNRLPIFDQAAQTVEPLQGLQHKTVAGPADQGFVKPRVGLKQLRGRHRAVTFAGDMLLLPPTIGQAHWIRPESRAENGGRLERGAKGMALLDRRGCRGRRGTHPRNGCAANESRARRGGRSPHRTSFRGIADHGGGGVR